MSELIDREKFQSELKRFLLSAVIIADANYDVAIFSNGDRYKPLYLRGPYRFTNEGVEQIYAPIPQWEAFLAFCNQYFDQHISAYSVQKVISNVLDNFQDDDPTTLTDEWVNGVEEEIWGLYETTHSVFTPVYGLKMAKDLAFVKLGNTTLYNGSKDSEFAKLVEKTMHSEMAMTYQDYPFFIITTYGDSEARERQVMLECGRALSLLRYIAYSNIKYIGITKAMVNEARYVSIQNFGSNYFVYDNSKEIGITNFGLEPFVLSSGDIDRAQEFDELDALNYHIENVSNPISGRIVHALEFYDSAVLAPSIRHALYRYIVSINIALPDSGHTKQQIIFKLQPLLAYGFDDESRIATTIKTFKELYGSRGDILHNYPGKAVSYVEVLHASGIALHVIRLMAKIAMELNWQSDQDAKDWFDGQQ